MSRATRASSPTMRAAPPCCSHAPLEPGRMGRCHGMAQLGRCNQVRRFCPVACGGCTLCRGHPLADAYIRLQDEAKPYARNHSRTPRCGLLLFLHIDSNFFVLLFQGFVFIIVIWVHLRHLSRELEVQFFTHTLLNWVFS